MTDPATDIVSFGYADIPAAEKTRRVGDVFARVARRYDVMNDAMSGGMHRLWKDMFVRRVKPRAGEAILDMAGGTGDIAFRLARAGADVTVADINPAMLEVGVARAAAKGVDGLLWGEENAEALSFADRSFDAYTIAFGIRNVTDIPAALDEAHRVLRRGGRFYCLEFSTTQWPGFRELYNAYSHRGELPLPGRIDPPLPRHAGIRGDDRGRRLRAHARRADPRRPGRDPQRLEDMTMPVLPGTGRGTARAASGGGVASVASRLCRPPPPRLRRGPPPRSGEALR